MKRCCILAFVAAMAPTHVGCGEDDGHGARTPAMIGDSNIDIFQWKDFWIREPQLKAKYSINGWRAFEVSPANEYVRAVWKDAVNRSVVNVNVELAGVTAELYTTPEPLDPQSCDTFETPDNVAGALRLDRHATVEGTCGPDAVRAPCFATKKEHEDAIGAIFSGFSFAGQSVNDLGMFVPMHDITLVAGYDKGEGGASLRDFTIRGFARWSDLQKNEDKYADAAVDVFLADGVPLVCAAIQGQDPVAGVDNVTDTRGAACQGNQVKGVWVVLAAEETERICHIKRTIEPPICTDPKHHVDENQNVGGSNRCRDDCDCDGARTCSPWRWCQGTSR